MARKAFSAFMLTLSHPKSSHKLPQPLPAPIARSHWAIGPCLASAGFLTEHTGDNTCVDIGQKQLLRQGSPDDAPGQQSMHVK